jgi:hypothetical protein
MKFSTVWNVLRVLAIVGLGGLLFLVNTLGTVSSRRLLADLRRGEVEVATETARERFRRIEETENQVLGFNLYGIPTLVILALLPYGRGKKSELVTTERAGSG